MVKPSSLFKAMEFETDYEEGRITSLNKWFEGTYHDEAGSYGYTLMTNWNDWDGWAPEDISWHGETPENSDEVEEKIKADFKAYIQATE